MKALLAVIAGAPAALSPRDAAFARRRELEGDPGFRERYLSGDAIAIAQMRSLNAAISGRVEMRKSSRRFHAMTGRSPRYAAMAVLWSKCAIQAQIAWPTAGRRFL